MAPVPVVAVRTIFATARIVPEPRTTTSMSDSPTVRSSAATPPRVFAFLLMHMAAEYGVRAMRNAYCSPESNGRSGAGAHAATTSASNAAVRPLRAIFIGASIGLEPWERTIE